MPRMSHRNDHGRPVRSPTKYKEFDIPVGVGIPLVSNDPVLFVGLLQELLAGRLRLTAALIAAVS